MPRPMLRQPQTQTQTNTILSATQNQQQKQQNQQMDKMKLDRLLRQPRSKRYMLMYLFVFMQMVQRIRQLMVL